MPLQVSDFSDLIALRYLKVPLTYIGSMSWLRHDICHVSPSATAMGQGELLDKKLIQQGVRPQLDTLESNRKAILIEFVPELIPSSWR